MTFPSPLPAETLRRSVAAFQKSSRRESLCQAGVSFGGFLATCVAMYFCFDVAWWLPAVLAPLAAGFLVRIFIIQHDCGHGAFFRTRRANDAMGLACSLLTFVPYLSWRRQHAGHHGIWNNLDRRTSGADIYSSCLTLNEYRSLGPWRRLWFRVTRNPVIANLLLPPVVFLLLYRTPFDMPRAWRRERAFVQLTNIAIVSAYGGLAVFLGFDRVAAVHLPVMLAASIAGVWLFSVQHRSETTVWARQDRWDAVTASLRGSSYLRLPRILQWFTGNIGLHHIHHLDPKVPNYRLQQAYDAVPELHDVPVLTLAGAFRAMFRVLWDERRERMVTLREARSLLDLPAAA